jgi:nuclear pore complex protein Nup160
MLASFFLLIFLIRQEDTSDWLLTDKVTSWPGTPTDRGWRYLRQSLDRHDNVETDYKYSKVTLETILAFDRFWPTPPWLIQTLEVGVLLHMLHSTTHRL